RRVGAVDPDGKPGCPRTRRTITPFADPFIPERGLQGLLLQPIDKELVVAEKGQAIPAGVEFTAKATADPIFKIAVAVQANQRSQARQELAPNRSNVVLVPSR